jgi:hypothetical protein
LPALAPCFRGPGSYGDAGGLGLGFRVGLRVIRRVPEKLEVIKTGLMADSANEH